MNVNLREVAHAGPGERFIPLRRQDVVTLCRARLEARKGDAEYFTHAVRLLEALLHHAFHADLEALKDLYAPFNPDLDARLLAMPDPAEVGARRVELTQALDRVLERANYERITDEDLLRTQESVVDPVMLASSTEVILALDLLPIDLLCLVLDHLSTTQLLTCKCSSMVCTLCYPLNVHMTFCLRT